MLMGVFLVANRDDDFLESEMGEFEGSVAAISPKFDSRELLDKILSKEDWDFVSRRDEGLLGAMFRRDRLEIKRRWLLSLRQRAEQAIGRTRSGGGVKRLSRYAFFRVIVSALLSCRRLSNIRFFAGAWRGLAATAQRMGSFVENGIAGAGELQERDRTRNLEVEEAIERVRRRDLSGLRSAFAGLTYLSSIRDYNSGRYFHEGLARSFSDEVMEKAIAACHAEIFERLVHSPLSHLTQDLEIYVGTVPEVPAIVLAAWSKLEPFRVLIPMNSDPVSTELFISNVRVALAILKGRGPNDERGMS